MPALFFNSDDGSTCHIELADPRLPESIENQIKKESDVWFTSTGMEYDTSKSELPNPNSRPTFFEWQRLDWIYEPSQAISAIPPYSFFVNDALEPSVRCREINSGRYRLSGSVNLGNAVGKTRFTIRDSRGTDLVEIGAEVFPQKLDYKDDFPAMLDEVTEEIYSLAFDVFKKTFASTKTHTTYHQTRSEWLNLFKVLATSLEQSIDTILRAPKSQLNREMRIKPVDRIKHVTQKSALAALRKPERYCRGGGIELAPGFKVSHLSEQHRQLTYDTQENRFVVWAIKDILKSLSVLIDELSNIDKQYEKQNTSRLSSEIDLLKSHQRKLRFRLMDRVFADVSSFNNQNQFSTTLTMAPGYKEFYHRYLLLRKGLTLSDDALFKMDYKDIATLYEYWCFLKTVRLLRTNPKYDLTSTDIVKIEHQRFSVNLKKGNKSAVHFKQRSSGDVISLYYNRSFPRKTYTHTFDQIPDNFIEFSRSGYQTKSEAQTFKVVLDAKYRFDRGTLNYPESKFPYGPPLDAVSQLHRYRDALLWEQDVDESVKVANKSIGGVILFPYPKDEQEFKQHPFYQSIERVNIGAIPLQPGAGKENALYKHYLDSLFEQSGEALTENRIRYDSRSYTTKRSAQQDLVMVGLVPQKGREDRLEYHDTHRCFYTQWHKDPTFPLEQVKAVALYDQQERTIYAWAQVDSVEFLLGKELSSTGTTWPARKPDAKHCVYHLKPLIKTSLRAGRQMQGNRVGRFFISRLGLELAIDHHDSDLLFIHSWDKYQEWKRLTTQYQRVDITRKTRSDPNGHDISELSFTPQITTD